MLFLVLRGEFDLAQLGLYIRVFDLGALDVGQDLLGLFDSSFRNQPSRRFGQPWHREEENDDEDELEGERKALIFQSADTQDGRYDSD